MFPTTILSVLCVTFLVELPFLVNLLYVFLVWLKHFSIKLLLLYYYYYYYYYYYHHHHYYFIIILFYRISFVVSYTENGGNLSEVPVNTYEITVKNKFTIKTDLSNECVENIAISYNPCSLFFFYQNLWRCTYQN